MGTHYYVPPDPPRSHSGLALMFLIGAIAILALAW